METKRQKKSLSAFAFDRISKTYFLGTKSGEQCRKRWLFIQKECGNRQHWSHKQSDRLAVIAQSVIPSVSLKEKFVHIIPQQWKEIAAQLNQHNEEGDPVRTARQCRERWINKIDPSVNQADFEPQEDAKLVLGLIKIGLNQWRKIAEFVNSLCLKPEKRRNEI